MPDARPDDPVGLDEPVAPDEPVEPVEPDEPDEPAEPAERVAAAPPPEAGARLVRFVLRPRRRRVDLAVAAILALLGFAAAVQVRSTQDDGLLATAREEDLVRILADLDNREERLRQEIAELVAQRERLSSGSGDAEAALEQARRRAQQLGVLAGTVAARGPGVELTISDPLGEVGADLLLDALEELRGAGAEAVQITGAIEPDPEAEDETAQSSTVRVVAATAFLDGPEREDGGARGVVVDGTLLRPPYRFTVIGDPGTLASAMAIPGGVEDVVARAGGRAEVVRRTALAVTSLRPLTTPRYAQPSPG